MRLGIAHHFGWAVAVTATADHRVVDRRRLSLIEPDLPAAPIHHRGSRSLDDREAAALVAQVRASVLRMASASLEKLDRDLPEPLASMSLRAWPSDFPTEIATLRRAPFESRADSVMYRELLAQLARERGLELHYYDAKTVERDAASLLGDRSDEVLNGPREALGPPWTKDHRMALAATVLAAST
jgi:hypothetical protein